MPKTVVNVVIKIGRKRVRTDSQIASCGVIGSIMSSSDSPAPQEASPATGVTSPSPTAADESFAASLDRFLSRLLEVAGSDPVNPPNAGVDVPVLEPGSPPASDLPPPRRYPDLPDPPAAPYIPPVLVSRGTNWNRHCYPEATHETDEISPSTSSADPATTERSDRGILCESIRLYQFAMPPVFNADICLICKEDFAPGEDKPIHRQILLMCGHQYHADCLNRWTDTHGTCPYCHQRAKWWYWGG
jgi:hypothetical protein